MRMETQRPSGWMTMGLLPGGCPVVNVLDFVLRAEVGVHQGREVGVDNFELLKRFLACERRAGQVDEQRHFHLETTAGYHAVEVFVATFKEVLQDGFFRARLEDAEML